MRDIFATTTSNGKYGIDGLKSVVSLANTLYNLVKATYFDDNKLDFTDLMDVAALGPALIGQGQQFAVHAGQLDEEITDLSEAEKVELNRLAGERINDPRYKKIVSGLLDVIDGISETIKEDNPTD